MIKRLVVGCAVGLLCTAENAAPSFANSLATSRESLPIAGEVVQQKAGPGEAAREINLRNTVTVEVVRKVADAVVYISTEKVIARTVRSMRIDRYGRLMPQESTRDETQKSLGSGFIVHESGYIVTNNHVVESARDIRVTLHGLKEYTATVVSADPDTDLAILKIETGSPLPVLALGDSSDLMIGEPVIAVGNPFGFSSSVSTGIVSAIDRDLAQPDATKATLNHLIQTDAAINPGNSGGPLLNAYGQVIGINTAIVSDANNIGFAIEVNRLRKLIPSLMDPGKVYETEVNLTLSERRTLTPPATVTASVEVETASGPQTVKTINGKRPRDIVDAYAIILAGGKANPIKIVTESGQTVAATPKAVAIPEAIAIARERLGIKVEPVTPEIRDRYALRVEDGMLVTEVVRRSIAERAQLKAGDVILGLGRGRVRTLADFGQLVQELPPKGRVPIGILRGSQLYYGALEL